MLYHQNTLKLLIFGPLTSILDIFCHVCFIIWSMWRLHKIDMCKTVKESMAEAVFLGGGSMPSGHLSIVHSLSSINVYYE